MTAATLERPTGRTMPAQKPGKSRQDYGTPVEFLDAVRCRFGLEAFALDVAASRTNAVAPLFYDSTDDALRRPWRTSCRDWAWCNPPFSRISLWVAKAWRESQIGARTLVLIPAAVGSNYWRDYVDGKAFVLLLYGRITFVGETDAYPKDCVLLVYGPDVAPGYAVWQWQPPKAKGTR